MNRFDVFTINAPKKDANGFLKVDSTPTRSGIFTYHEPDGLGGLKQVRELRHPDDVFSQETLDSLAGVPYTTQENHVALFTPDDSKNKTFGMTMEDVSRVDNHARVSIKIVDGKEIAAIEGKNGLELSAGYRCDVISETGEFNGEPYDKRQTNIRYNHVARLKKKNSARGGETCRIRLDSKSAICGIEAERIDSEEISKNHKEESIMEIIQRELPEVTVGDFRLDAEEVELPKEYKGVITQLKKREKRFTTALKEAVEKFDSLTTEATANQAKIDVLTGENKDLKEANENSIPADKLDSAVRERAKYLSYAKDYKLDGADDMANDDIVRGIVKISKKVKDETKLDDMTYTNAVFDMLEHEYEKKKLDSADNLDNHKIDPKDSDKKVSKFDESKRRKNA